MTRVFKRILALVFENFGWKILSVAVGVVLWAMVATEPTLSTFETVLVDYKNLPDKLEISSEPVNTVTLELQGPSGELSGPRDTNIHPSVILDMKDVGPGERTFPVVDKAVKLPRGVHLVRAIPPEVRFNFDRSGKREVPVKVRTTGQARPGYVVASTTADPETLDIVGPAGRLARVSAAMTDAVDISQTSGTAVFQVNAYLEDPYVRINGSPQVEVTVIMRKN